VSHPDAAVDGVDADDGGLRVAADAAEQPQVVAEHHRQPHRHQHEVQVRRTQHAVGLWWTRLRCGGCWKETRDRRPACVNEMATTTTAPLLRYAHQPRYEFWGQSSCYL
jgi:hypothetical protein